MTTDDRETWRRLGRYLQARRVQLDANWVQRDQFVIDNGLKRQHRSIADLETGRRTNYTAATLGLIERAYRLPAGAIDAYIHDGRPLPTDGGTGPEREEGPSDEEKAARAWIAAHPVEAMREVMRAAMRDPAVRAELGIGE